MKRKLWVLALSLVMLFTTATIASAAGEERFSLVASPSSPEVGQEVAFTLKGEQLTDVYGYEIQVTYDADKLEYKSVSSLVKGWSIEPVREGNRITFAHTKVGSSTKGDNGTVELAKLSFKTVKEGEAKVELATIKLVDSSVKSIELQPKTSAAITVKAAKIEETGPKASFSDISGHWAEANVLRAAGIGFVNGYTDGTFRPNGQVTRAEFVTMLAKATSLKAQGESKLDFKDLDTIPSWAKPYVGLAVDTGIVNGYSDHTFRPSQTITRAEMAVMAARMLQLPTQQEPKLNYADTDRIASWAGASVAAVSEAGLMKGKGGNRFAPQEMTTRAEAVTLLLSLLDYQAQ